MDGNEDELLGSKTGFEPFARISEEAKSDSRLPTQLREIVNHRQKEWQNLITPIFDEASRQDYIDTNELKTRLMDAKWKWLVDKKVAQFRPTTNELEEEKAIAEEYDDWIRPRVEFMYDYMDFDTERAKIRTKFLDEMHKKTTLKDVGDKLDEVILSSKASMLEYWDHSKHVLEQPKSATQDLD